ncbi:MAG TPA: hypothetical protein VNI56_03720 [Xanthomonadaceae bacterium]|nr:hypothetical protein [Xanthomonadaceae bacterium]
MSALADAIMLAMRETGTHGRVLRGYELAHMLDSMQRRRANDDGGVAA